MERIRRMIGWIAEESLFWGEVIGEVLGIDRNKYQEMVEKRQREIERERALERKRELYAGLTV
jgi:hypothetical protein